jgi:hypothetical protein
MERVARTFGSFADADAADLAYYAAMSPQQRVDLLLDLIAAYQESVGEAAQGLARVCRVAHLTEG